MMEDLANHRWVQDEREDPHLGTAFWAEQGIDLVDLANELGPRSAESLPLGGGKFGSRGISIDGAR